MERHISSALRSRLPVLLRHVPAPVVGLITGLSRDQAAELKSNDRLIPPAPVLERLALRMGITPTRAVTFDPAGSLRDIVPEWFPEGRTQARITLVGMGNLGHVQAGLLGARPDVHVTCLVSSPERAATLRARMAETDGITVTWGDGTTVHGRPDIITDNAAEAVGEADLVFLATPCHLHLQQMRTLMPLMRDGAALSSGPAWGGFNWKARKVLGETGKRLRVFGLGGIPTMSKMDVPGQRARVVGVPKAVNVQQALDRADSVFASDVLSLLFGMPVLDVHNYLNINLAPGNQLLHTGIMYDLFRDWDGSPLSEPPLFYEGLSRTGAALLKDMSRELMAAALTLSRQRPEYWLFRRASLHVGIRMGYAGQIANPWTLYSAIRTNGAYKGIRTPMLTVDGGHAPNFGSRFFGEDVPDGLAIVKGVADIVGVGTPRIDEVMGWCQDIMGKEYVVNGRLTGRDVPETAAPQAFGLTDAESLVRSCVPA